MKHMEANKAMIHCKEQVDIGTSQTRKCVKHYAIRSNKDVGRAMGLWEELYPMCVVIVGHDSLNYPTPSNDPSLYT
jgi:hypothetical protein